MTRADGADISRTGIVTAGEVIDATAEAFNMGTGMCSPYPSKIIPDPD